MENTSLSLKSHEVTECTVYIYMFVNLRSVWIFFFYHRFLCCYLFNGNCGKRTYLGGSSVGLSPFSNIKDVISLSGINWSLRWSYFSTLLWNLLIFGDYKSYAYLQDNRRYPTCQERGTLRYISFQSDRNKCGQTSRSATRAEVQTSCDCSTSSWSYCSLLAGVYVTWLAILLERR